MARKDTVVKKGLRTKMFRLCISLVLVASVAFGVIGILQLRNMVRLASEMSESQNESIKRISGESVTKLTRENMINTIRLSAQNADNKFRTMKDDFLLLASEVQDVFEHPERYGERNVYPPDQANKGIYTLQVVFGNPAVAEDLETMTMLRKLANLEPTMRGIVQGSDDVTGECFIALPNAATLEMDAKSQNKFDENGEILPYDPTVRPWYTKAVKKGEFSFTLAVHSYYLEIPEFEYSVPVYVNEELKAVLQGATNLTVIQDFMTNVGVGEKGFSIMISNNGQMVYSPRESGELAMIHDMSSDIRTTGNMQLQELLDKAMSDPSGFGEADIDGESYYAAYASIPTVGWTQITFIPKIELEGHTNKLLKEMDTVESEAAVRFKGNAQKSTIVILVVVVLLIANAFLAAMALSGKILNPINKMTGQVKDMSGDQFVFTMDDVYRTGDEIEVLASTFGTLSDRMEGYLRNILAMTAEKERVSTELSIATKIQADMLPDATEAFANRKEFELFASMTPAKAVGGDFYDFFLIDDDHLCLVIADVSDKGIPAALFMMSAMMIINSRAKQGGTPCEILTDANVRLCVNNKSKMFVTVWLGILELSTGRMTCTNAGHEYPMIRGTDGQFRLFEDRHGLVVGAMKRSKYKDYELQLHPGDAVFVYTDGVPEANNAEGEFYGEERLEAALNRVAAEGPKEIISGVKADIDTFVAGAHQFDDLTMLCVAYKGVNL